MKNHPFSSRFAAFALSVAALIFAGCDKISPDEYTLFDGLVVSWSTGTPIDSPQKRVLVEKFTGPKCTNCPMADRTLDEAHRQVGDNLVTISVNTPDGQGVPYPGQPDMRTDGGTAWCNHYGVSEIPAAFINRNADVKYSGAMENIVGDIRTAIQGTPVVALEVEAEGDAQVAARIRVQFLEDCSDELTLTVALLEDSLVYLQAMPAGSPVVRDSNYVHNHMLRQVVTSPWGSDLQATGKAGECLLGQFTFVPPADAKLKNCHLVAFVSDKASRRVLNSASCNIRQGE
ncbi:MAG: Omp28-related outer membrane protein [Bacteroidales bacterium]|nr:Omp28-related outer membrane protein [Bacteroidales bacterium]